MTKIEIIKMLNPRGKPASFAKMSMLLAADIVAECELEHDQYIAVAHLG